MLKGIKLIALIARLNRSGTVTDAAQIDVPLAWSRLDDMG